MVQKEVEQARDEATDNDHFLKTLQGHFDLLVADGAGLFDLHTLQGICCWLHIGWLTCHAWEKSAKSHGTA